MTHATDTPHRHEWRTTSITAMFRHVACTGCTVRLALPQPDPLAELDAYCPECGEWITATDGYCVWHEEPVKVDVTAPRGVMPCPPKTTPSDA